MKKMHVFTFLVSFFVLLHAFIQPVSAQVWEPANGPFGGPVQCFAENGNYLFCGIGTGVFAKGAFRSADHGATWTSASTGLPTTGQGLDVVAMAASGNYMVASAGGYIYRTNNNGDLWTMTGYSGQYNPVTFISVGSSLFCGGTAGLFVSTDNGLTWTEQNSGFQGINAPNVPNIRSFAICGNYIYTSTSGKGVFRSSDNGVTWTTVNTGLGTTTQLNSRTFNNLGVAGTDLFVSSIGQGVFRLIDNGTTWTAESTGLTTSAKNVLSLLVKGTQVYCGGNDGLWASNNTGPISWSRANGNIGIRQFRNLFISGSDVFSGIGSQGVYLSTDNLSSWIGKNQGIHGLSTQRITKAAGSIYSTTYYGGLLYRSSDLGATWEPGNISTDNGPWSNSTALFCTANGSYFYRSTDNGATWQSLMAFFDLVWGEPTSFYAAGDTIFAGGGGTGGAAAGVFYSTDNGDTWNETTGNTFAPSIITSNGQKLYAAGAGIAISTDNGLTWTPMAASTPGTVNSLIFTNAGIFISTASGVYLSKDECNSWNAVNTGFPIPNPGVGPLVTSGTDLFAGTSAGVYYSANNGENWSLINLGLPTPQNVTSMIISDDYLFINNLLVGQPVYRLSLAGAGTIPAQPGAISGAGSPCIGSSQSYSVANTPGTLYTWQFPYGWSVISGGNSNSVTVTAGTFQGVVMVTPSNVWGSGPAQYMVVTPTSAPPSQPGAITGPAHPVEGTSETYSVTSVPGVTYTWTFPAGWNQTSGGNSSSVAVTVGSTGGNIQVTPSTLCGSGTPRVMGVVPVPAIASVGSVTVSNGQVNCYNASESITVAGNGTSFIVQNGGQATFISGQAIHFMPGTLVEPGGNLLGYITTTLEFCTNPSPFLPVNPAGAGDALLSVPEFVASNTCIVYPNPTTGNFTLEQKASKESGMKQVDIYDVTGQLVRSVLLNGENRREFSTEQVKPGLYYLHVTVGDHSQTLKLIKL